MDQQAEPPGPARPQKLESELIELPDSLAVRTRPGGPAAFLLLWLIGWTVGCVALAATALREPKLSTLAFGVPFWASWLFVAGLLIWMVLGRETLLLGQQRAIFLRTAIVRLSLRTVPCDEIVGFREYLSTVSENEQRLRGIEMVTLGKPVRFASRLPDQERAWLIDRLNRFLELEPPGGLAGEGTATAPAESTGAANDWSARATGGRCRTIGLEDTLAEPPSDCDWTLAEEFEGPTFLQRGRLSLVTLITMLFMTVFWNGIVSVFVLSLSGFMPGPNPPVGWEWWGLFVFLIPFEVIGLVMLGALVLVLVDPLRRTRWQLQAAGLVHEHRWLAFRRRQETAIAGLDRVELRRDDPLDSQGRRAAAITRWAATADFQLALVSRENHDLAVIDSLTEGEARWMAGVMFETRKNWFAGRPGG